MSPIRRAYTNYEDVIWKYFCVLLFVSFLTAIYGRVSQRLCQVCAGNDIRVFRYFCGKVLP